MPETAGEPSLREACRILFGRAISAEEIMRQMKPGELKAAFRSRALATHPDRCQVLGQEVARLHEEFLRVVGAYQVVKEALEHPPRPVRTAAPKPAPSADAPRRAIRRYHQGPVPQRVLRIGEFVYYSGLISWGDLIAALIWQKNQRPSLGDIAMSWRLMTPEGVSRVLSSRRFGERFGECAVRLGLISRFWLRAIMLHQAKLQPKLGDFFMQRELLCREDLTRCMAELQRHNRSQARKAA